MKLPLKAFAVLAITFAATSSMAQDPSAEADCSRQGTDDTRAACATPQAGRTVAQLDAKAKSEVTRIDPATAADVSRLERGIARRVATARPPINGAVLADGVTIDGGQ
jgi:hypothetical protein